MYTPGCRLVAVVESFGVATRMSPSKIVGRRRRRRRSASLERRVLGNVLRSDRRNLRRRSVPANLPVGGFSCCASHERDRHLRAASGAARQLPARRGVSGPARPHADIGQSRWLLRFRGRDLTARSRRRARRSSCPRAESFFPARPGGPSGRPRRPPAPAVPRGRRSAHGRRRYLSQERRSEARRRRAPAPPVNDELAPMKSGCLSMERPDLGRGRQHLASSRSSSADRAAPTAASSRRARRACASREDSTLALRDPEETRPYFTKCAAVLAVPIVRPRTWSGRNPAHGARRRAAVGDVRANGAAADGGERPASLPACVRRASGGPCSCRSAAAFRRPSRRESPVPRAAAVARAAPSSRASAAPTADPGATSRQSAQFDPNACDAPISLESGSVRACGSPGCPEQHCNRLSPARVSLRKVTLTVRWGTHNVRHARGLHPAAEEKSGPGSVGKPGPNARDEPVTGWPGGAGRACRAFAADAQASYWSSWSFESCPRTWS